jgi:very-short-patch-repair endonuclease
MNYADLRKLMTDPQQVVAVQHQTAFLDQHYTKVTIRQRLWHLEHNRFEIMCCETCGKPAMGWSTKNLAYSRFCDSKCAQSNHTVRKKTEQTCMQRYGASTNLSTLANQAKQQQTNLKRYGVTNAAQSDVVKAKIKQAHEKNWGVTNASKCDIVKEKITQTHQTRYSRKRASQQHIDPHIIDLKNNRELMLHWFQDLKMPVYEIAERLGVCSSQLCVHFKTNLGIDISRHMVSRTEREVQDYVSSLVECEFNNRAIIAPKELDIVIPSHQLAIEVDGLAWHTELRGKSPRYHWHKAQLCRQQGWRLINILDIEWQQKPELTQSRIRSVLGLNQRLAARKCQVVQLTHHQADQFLQTNHSQGGCASSVRLGLMHQDQLVAVLTMGRSRFDRGQQWELIRYASAVGINVQGGAGKLWHHFVQQWNPKSVISYCDARLNRGNLYAQLGFTWQRNNGPNYWYTYQYRTWESRMRYQKHKLAGVLEHFDPNQTEWANMQAHGWDRYWDCGSSVWLWTAASC